MSDYLASDAYLNTLVGGLIIAFIIAIILEYLRDRRN